MESSPSLSLSPGRSRTSERAPIIVNEGEVGVVVVVAAKMGEGEDVVGVLGLLPPVKERELKLKGEGDAVEGTVKVTSVFGVPTVVSTGSRLSSPATSAVAGEVEVRVLSLLSVLSFSSASLVASLAGSVVSEDVSPNDNEPNERVLNEGVVVGVVAKEKAGVVVGVVVVGVVVEAAFVSPGASLVSAVVSLSSLAGATSDLGFSTFRGTMHTVDAASGLTSVQQAHSHPSFLGAAAGMVNPALPNAGVGVAVEAVEDALTAGRETMHAEHVDAASGLISVQQAHSHPSFLGAAGMVNPALPKEGAAADVANDGVGVVVPPENDGKEEAGVVEEGVPLVSEERDSEPNEKVLVGVADAVVSVGLVLLLSSFLSLAGRERENAGVVAAPAVAVVDGRKEKDVVGVGPVVVDSVNEGGFSVPLEEVEEAFLDGSVAVVGLPVPPKDDGKVKAGVVEVVGVVEGVVVVVGVLLTVLLSGFDLAADFLESSS